MNPPRWLEVDKGFPYKQYACFKSYFNTLSLREKPLRAPFPYSVLYHFAVIPHTVPVRCDHQVKCVPGVLSMGNDSPHMYGVRTIENEMKPWEILEKMQF